MDLLVLVGTDPISISASAPTSPSFLECGLPRTISHKHRNKQREKKPNVQRYMVLSLSPFHRQRRDRDPRFSFPLQLESNSLPQTPKVQTPDHESPYTVASTHVPLTHRPSSYDAVTHDLVPKIYQLRNGKGRVPGVLVGG
jgi:hypothetical protein